MKIIKKFLTLFTKLRNDENFSIHKIIIKNLKAKIMEFASLVPFFNDYEAKFDRLDVVYKQYTKYLESKILINLYEERKNIYLSIKYAIEGAALSHIDDLKVAATYLGLIIDNYKGASHVIYSGSVGMFHNMIQDFQSPENAPYLQALSLEAAVNKLHEFNEDFEDVYALRSNKKNLGRSHSIVRAARREVDLALNELALSINTLYRMNRIGTKDEEEEEKLGSIIDEINAFIKQFEEAYYRHVNTKKPQKPDEPDPENPEPFEEYQFVVAQQIVETDNEMKIIDTNPEAFAEKFAEGLEGSILTMRKDELDYNFPFKQLYLNTSDEVIGLIVGPPAGLPFLDPFEGRPIDEAFLINNNKVLIRFTNAQLPSFID